jgi:outer membrane autotransporter protein
LNVFAQNLIVTSDTTVSGAHYENNGNTYAALTNTGTWTFTGSDVTLTGTAASGNGRFGANFTGGGRLNLTNSEINANFYGLQLTDTSAATLTNTVINSGSVANGHGVYLTTSSTLTMIGGAITTGATGAAGVSVATTSGVSLSDLTINSYGAGVSVGGSSTATLNNVNITTQNAGGFGLSNSATATYVGGTVTTNRITSANQRGISVSGTGTVLEALRDVAIFTYNGDASYGLFVENAAIGMIDQVQVESNGWVSHAAYFSRAALIGPITNSSFQASGAASGMLIISSTVAQADRVTISANGQLWLAASTFTGAMELRFSSFNGTNISIASMQDYAPAVYISETSTLTISGGSIVTRGDNSNAISMELIPSRTGAGSTVSLNDVNISTVGANSHGISMAANSVTPEVQTFVFSGGTIQTAQSAAIAINTPFLNPNGTPANASQLHGIGTEYRVTLSDATVSGAAVLQVGSIITGTDAGGDLVPVDRQTVANITVSDHTTLIGDVNIDDTATVTLGLADRSTLTGEVIVSDSASLKVGLDDSALTGNTTAGNDAAITLTGSNGATITGTLTGSDNATIEVTVSGPGSSFIGDTNQTDDSQITVILDHGATGSGGFTGGNLSVGDDSEWHFTKDSAADHIDSHGVIRVGTSGNYIALHSDTISGDGTWYFPIDSDTGAKSTVSGSTAATSHPRGIISATGDGLRDPNTVANTLVTGENKANWLWDNFSWGLDEYTQDGHDSAGNPHFTQHGTSPIGAVLNSAIAIQPSLWVAQQDNLLKRMGELRYGARASRPPAGGTPALHNLIENIWLRSYGQQLNVGSQVSGKAYEQLIYGVDLGTDHKFTISADSDLYLGLYAGYGRSDLDYRTPGTDGELNSYYGGLYATWLHSSGFYLDATFKAASVNNDLKAPYGNTQLKASYSDVNLGGSLELGKKFTFKDDWFIEPQFQVNYLHILAENYTAGPMTITAQDLDALQLRIGSLFGRTINLTNSGALQPYIKISGVETISSGGTLRNGYQSTRANTDGARVELGAGLIWQLDANNQLHLDYEASFGDKYDKPWGLTAGYRHQF